MRHFKKTVRGEPQNYDTTFLHRDGHQIELNLTHLPIIVEGQVIGIYCIAKDVTELKQMEEERKKAEEKIKHMAYYDELTGLPNRRLFMERLSAEMMRSEEEGTKFAVMFIDMDRFKSIYDSLGHAFGDLLLTSVSRIFTSCICSKGMVARMGGDEFTIILPGLMEKGEAAAAARDILDALEQPLNLEGQEIHITPSIGIALFPEDGLDAETLMKHADNAMYIAKKNGRNHYEFHSAVLEQQAYERFIIENGLHKAIKHEQLLVYYQPQMSIKTGKIIGMEALIRWNHPEKGFIPPGVFIPVAEESGLILPIGEWMLRTACRQNKRWQDGGLPPVSVSVNLSIRQFMNPYFID